MTSSSSAPVASASSGDRRRPAELVRELVEHARQADAQLLQAAWDVHRPGLVAEVATNLADDRRHRVARELHAAVDVEAVDRLDQPERADLDEILQRLPPAGVAVRQRAHERHELDAGPGRAPRDHLFGDTRGEVHRRLRSIRVTIRSPRARGRQLPRTSYAVASERQSEGDAEPTALRPPRVRQAALTENRTRRRRLASTAPARAPARAAPWSSSTGPRMLRSRRFLVELVARRPRGPLRPLRRCHRAAPRRCLPSRACDGARASPLRARSLFTVRAAISSAVSSELPLVAQRLLDVLVLACALRSLLHSTWRHRRPPSIVVSRHIPVGPPANRHV